MSQVDTDSAMKPNMNIIWLSPVLIFVSFSLYVSTDHEQVAVSVHLSTIGLKKLWVAETSFIYATCYVCQMLVETYVEVLPYR